MIKKTFNRGFTLIELLVVIAIIGILSSVVLASLNSARAKGADASIKSNLANIRAQAELVYDGPGCYGDGDSGDTACAAFTEGTCTFATSDTLFKNAVIAGQIQAAANSSGAAANAVCSAESSGSAWAVAVQMKSNTGQSWCVDSKGTSKAYTGTPANAITTSACN